MKTLESIRKEASELKIKNYTRYSKPELLILIDEVRSQMSNEVPSTESKDLLQEKNEILKESLNLPVVFTRPIFDVLKENFEKKEKKSRYLEIPREGTQAKEIYDIFKKHLGHKKWTVYRVTKEFGYSLNNVRRIYKKYFEEQNKILFLQETK